MHTRVLYIISELIDLRVCMCMYSWVLHSLIFESLSRHNDLTEEIQVGAFLWGIFSLAYKWKEVRSLELHERGNVSSSVSSVKREVLITLIHLFLLYRDSTWKRAQWNSPGNVIPSAISLWKLCFAVCSSVHSGVDINLTSYEMCLKSSANASVKQRQMTFAELNSYPAVTLCVCAVVLGKEKCNREYVEKGKKETRTLIYVVKKHRTI